MSSKQKLVLVSFWDLNVCWGSFIYLYIFVHNTERRAVAQRQLVFFMSGSTFELVLCHARTHESFYEINVLVLWRWRRCVCRRRCIVCIALAAEFIHCENIAAILLCGWRTVSVSLSDNGRAVLLIPGSNYTVLDCSSAAACVALPPADWADAAQSSCWDVALRLRRWPVGSCLDFYITGGAAYAWVCWLLVKLLVAHQRSHGMCWCVGWMNIAVNHDFRE